MNAKVKQQFGIKYPFTTEKNENYFVDTNMTLKEKVRVKLKDGEGFFIVLSKSFF